MSSEKQHGLAGADVPGADISVRPFEAPEEYAAAVEYFCGGSDAFLRGMGVDPARLPAREVWLAQALADHELPDAKKERLYVGWFFNGELVGHSSASHIVLGDRAHIHLHVWRPELRQAGLGSECFARSIDIYFERLKLQLVVCEPNAANPGPNRTLTRLGFERLHTHRCIPTEIALEQDVSHWELTRDAWQAGRTH